MAELADALVSGTSEGNFMQVQVLLSAYNKEPMGATISSIHWFFVVCNNLNLRRFNL